MKIENGTKLKELKNTSFHALALLVLICLAHKIGSYHPSLKLSFIRNRQSPKPLCSCEEPAPNSLVFSTDLVMFVYVYDISYELRMCILHCLSLVITQLPALANNRAEHQSCQSSSSSAAPVS